MSPVTSEAKVASGNRRRRTACAGSLLSQSSKVWCPERWKPSSKPPMPAYSPDTSIRRVSQIAVENGAAVDRQPPDPGAIGDRDSAIAVLHDLCGVYTKPDWVSCVLDRIGWTADADLATARLLEPASGDGAFLIEAAVRLIQSLRQRGPEPTIRHLRERIVAFEIVAREATKARQAVVDALVGVRIHPATARAAAAAWVRADDFLLAKLPQESFTHVAGNPPYVRWAKVPSILRTVYANYLPTAIARGDLLLPFLDRSFSLLAPGGRCGFVCSDRWRYALYARPFRAKWLDRLDIESEPAERPSEAFDRQVYVYPDILTASLRISPKPAAKSTRKRGKTLEELGCTVRVGPALGFTKAFVVGAGETSVEPDVLHPWVDTDEVRDGAVQRLGRRVIATRDADGNLLDLAKYPKLAAHLEEYRERLEQRYIVRQGDSWYRTIDRIVPADWAEPKLLVPELAKVPRVAIDRSGAIPSHGIYCIFSPGSDIDEIYERLCDGKLARALVPIAPKVKGAYTRCYRRFLMRMSV